MLTDLHSHSECSFDGSFPFEVMCDTAFNRNIGVFACTDHCDLTPEIVDAEVLGTARLSIFNSQTQKKRFAEKMTVISGIELGQPMHNLPLAEKIVNLEGLDFTLCSVHNLKGKLDFYYIDYNNEDINGLLSRYFDEILETVAWNKFDSLAHLTYPLRYIEGEFGVKVELNQFGAQIDKILSALAKNGKALEINTSGLSKKLKNTMPPEQLVKRFRQLGGEYITVGSDSHVPDSIGNGIETAILMAKNCGFEYITFFENHIPEKIAIK